MRSGAGVPDDGTAAGSADPLTAAAALRWSRPDLTGALADHVLETAVVTDDRDLWLAAAGWAVHARSATGDGREIATEVVDSLPGWGADVLSPAVGHRLRIELAMVAVNAQLTGAATALVAPVIAEGADDLRADAFGVLARCAVEDAADRVEALLGEAELVWSAVPAPLCSLGSASVALVGAAAHRRAGRPIRAADRAAAGLARLEQAGIGPAAGSGHLAAALAAEWLLALLDAGQIDDAKAGCVELAQRMAGHRRPSRQLARLRLAVARTTAVDGTVVETARALARAVQDAAECDAPDLEAVCCAALGSVYEKANRPDLAETAVERAQEAQLRDRERGARFPGDPGRVVPRVPAR
jgi:hypothetical protein